MNPTNPLPAPSPATPMAEQGLLDGTAQVDPAELETWLDRLVDGEISDPQRGALLNELERRPGGWRQCALAFLEAQAWREAIGNEPFGSSRTYDNDALGSHSLDSVLALGQPVQLSDAGRSVRRRSISWRPVVGLLAAAASFALAFGLGLLVHSAWLAGKMPFAGQGSFAANAPSTAPNTGPSLANRGSPNDAGSSDAIAALNPHTSAVSGTNVAAVGKDSTPAKNRWGTVQVFVTDQHGAPRQVALPVVEGPGASEWLRQQPTTVPAEVMLDLLRREGHHVETQRRYVPVPLDDGRDAVFPVDRVEVRYLGGRGYQ